MTCVIRCQFFRRPRLMFRPGFEPGPSRSADPCYSEMRIPIPKTLVIWASPSHITLAIWVRVRVTGDVHITRALGMGIPKRRRCSYHCDNGTIPTELTDTRLPNGMPGFVFRQGQHSQKCCLCFDIYKFATLETEKELVTAPEDFAKVNSTQFPLSFLKGRLVRHDSLLR